MVEGNDPAGEYRRLKAQEERAKAEVDALEFVDPVKWFNSLEEWSELGIVEIQQIGTTDARYYLLLDNEERIALGSAYDLTQFPRVQSAIFSHSKVVLSKATFGAKNWERYMKALVRGSSITQEIGDQLHQQAEDWIRDIAPRIAEKAFDLTNKDDLLEIIKHRQKNPGDIKAWRTTENEVLLQPANIVTQLSISSGIKMQMATVHQGLRLIGFAPTILQVRLDGSVPKKRMWVSSKGYYHQVFGVYTNGQNP